MNSLTDKAVTNFRSGLNCAQAVISAYTDEMKIDAGLALSLSCSFGGGMGRMMETCGAVTGSYMVIGVYNCRKFNEDKDRKEHSYSMVQEFSRQFKEKNGSTDCIDLLKHDLKTEEGKKYIHDHNLHEKICEVCIADAINILGKIMR
ncbi:MAG: C_GCAxxG_C_C family protein [Bacteroidales bacterium]|nr:C_GCAxxG_C_C family protein [Bacteroidales bacterium]